ncbi:hypothetical protein D3C72_1362300 [compost metagenome]
MDINTGAKEDLPFTKITNVIPALEAGLFLIRHGQNDLWSRYDVSTRNFIDFSAVMTPWQDSTPRYASTKALHSLTPDGKYFVFIEQKRDALYYIQIDVSNGKKVSSGEIPDHNYHSHLVIDKDTVVLAGETAYTKLNLPTSTFESVSPLSRTAFTNAHLSENGKAVIFVDLSESSVYKMTLDGMKIDTRDFKDSRVVNIDHESLWIHDGSKGGLTTKVRISDLSDDNRFEAVEGAIDSSLFTNISKDFVLINSRGPSGAPFGIYFTESLHGKAPYSFNGRYDEGSPYRIHQATAAASGDKLYIEYQKGSEFGLDVWHLKTGTEE